MNLPHLPSNPIAVDPTDLALAAVLQAHAEGGDWRDSLPADQVEEAEIWAGLTGDLQDALRLGPGGLTSEQRENILTTACHPVFLRTGTWNRPLPVPARAPAPPYKWLAGAAAVAAITLLGARFIPVSGGIRAEGWNQTLVAKSDRVEPAFHVRLWPGERFEQGTAIAAAANSPVSRDGDWSAVGPGGGFQPTAMANVSEVVPALSAMPSLPLQDLLPMPIGAGRASTAALIQHFRYSYPSPDAGEALSLCVQTGPCPWNPGNLLVHVGIQATDDPRFVPGARSHAVSDLRLLLDFNPSLVSAYRLVGYGGTDPDSATTRPGPRRGADLLAGQSITAIYEIVPAGKNAPASGENPRVRWKSTHRNDRGRANDELLATRLTYRLPGRDKAFEEQTVVNLNDSRSALPRGEFEFSAAVAACALILDRAPGMQHYRIEDALALAQSSIGTDPDGRRAEFVRLLASRKNG